MRNAHLDRRASSPPARAQAPLYPKDRKSPPPKAKYPKAPTQHRPPTQTPSKAKQPAPPLPKRINDQRTQEQADGNANSHLNHRIPDIEHHAIDIGVRRSLRAVADRRRPRGVAGDLVGGSDAADEGAAGGQAGGDLNEDGGEEGGGRDAVLEARVEVAEHADGEGAERVGHLRVGREAFGREVVDDVAGEGDDDHDGRLAPFRLVDDDQAHCEQGDEHECVVRGKRRCTGCCGRCVLVDEAVDGGAYGDAEAEKQGVYDCVDHPYRTGDDGARLEFQRAAH